MSKIFPDTVSASTTNSDPWHYPRPELATSALSLFEHGAAALTIFERRRMGKTEFLLRDLLPVAETTGWRVFYMSFLGTATPTETFARNLAAFAQKDGKLAAIIQSAGDWAAKLPLKKIGPVELKTDALPAPELPDIFNALNAAFPRTLLLLDEIQTLATGPKTTVEQNQLFVGSLRTGLDTHKAHIKAVFTGSSQNGLRRMFNDHGNAFYRYASAFEIPKLERGFTDFLCTRSRTETGRDLDADALAHTFTTQLAHNPALARRLVEKMLSYPTLSVADASALVLHEDGADYHALWESLSFLQRALLLYVAKGGERPYSKKSLQILSAQIGVELTPSGVQQALLRLSKGGGSVGDILTNTGVGHYAFQDEGFKQFVEQEEG